MSMRTRVISAMLMVCALGVAGAALADNVRMFVRHEVTDYSTFRKTYDSPAIRKMQTKGGVIAQSVYQSVDDPNDITVIHDFHSLSAAKAFAASAELKAAMEKGGVKGPPTIWFTVKKGR
jgi:quinol monooxygenase YgiN